MPANTDHPSFPQPVESTSIWRYMDLARYLDIVTRGRMFLSRQDKFRDTFEGAIPTISRKALAQQSEDIKNELLASAAPDDPRLKLPTMEAQVMAFMDGLRRDTFISCWHMNSGESAAMWDLYGRDGSAIAFRTSYEKLKDQLPSYSYIGMVRYIDFDKDAFSLDNAMNPSMHKRRSFEHENEVRVVIQHLGEKRDGFETKEKYNEAHELTDFGLTIPFDIDGVIDEVFLSPDAAPWFERLIRETNLKLGVKTPVRKSTLYDAALF